MKKIIIFQNAFDMKNNLSMLGKRKCFLTRKGQKKKDGLDHVSNYFLTGNISLKT